MSHLSDGYCVKLNIWITIANITGNKYETHKIQKYTQFTKINIQYFFLLFVHTLLF